MSKIVAYVSEWCGNCHIILPKLEAYARRHGISFKKVDVDKCSTETCESISYVPHITIDGRPMSDTELGRIIDG